MRIKKLLPFIPPIFILAVLSAGLWLPQGLTFLIPKCWVKSWFGFPCPGCGLTSSFMALAQGHVVEAIKHNAAGPVLYLILGIGAYDYTRRHWDPQSQPVLTLKASQGVSLFFMLILLVQWFMKMYVYLTGG